MGRFSTITPVNIADTVFRHNGESFQTYSLPDGEDVNNNYFVFNGQLYIDYEDGEKHDVAKPVKYMGTVNIYNTFTDRNYETWVEYELNFSGGILKSVTLIKDEVTKDLRDANDRRPRPSSPCVTISLSDSNEVYKNFHADLNTKLNAIRDIIGEPKATIVYPHKSEGTGMFSHTTGMVRQIHSVVQSMDDFISAGEIDGKNALVTAKEINGASIVIFDEFHLYSAKLSNQPK